jgi:hypothetical protein
VIAGIDYSTRAVDVVLLDEDTDAATWHRFELDGNGAFDRARSVRACGIRHSSIWEDVLAIGIENPGGKFGTEAMYRVQGAILACLPWTTLVQPFPPAQWRKTVGLPGNAPKLHISEFVTACRVIEHQHAMFDDWPQDACDAYCIALATRTLLERVPA